MLYCVIIFIYIDEGELCEDSDSTLGAESEQGSKLLLTDTCSSNKCYIMISFAYHMYRQVI